MAILDLCKDDFNNALIEAASFGRDCDTIGSIVGSIGGSLYGAGAIRNDWIETCEEANKDFFEELHGDQDVGFEDMSERLIDALVSEHRQTIEREHELGKLLDSDGL